MAAITTTSYFTDDIIIPNLAGTGAINVAIQNKVASYIDTYEAEFLKLLLGDDTYEDFIAGIAESPWKELKDQIWKVTVISSTLSRYASPCARYIYFKLTKDGASFASASGEVQPAVENGQIIAPVARMVNCWNRMADQCEEIWKWMEDDARKADYPDFSRPYPNYLAKINQFGI